MSDIKQVKVDNWGIYFLQRLKHFFNRTDYCDLTLQFQDNAQLKVHRLVLSACTEYFELLERTCEMYEDCLVMPDDLQADVVVPIINFMYTGQLEFKMDLLEKLYQTSLVMNMPVLTKLLASHRHQTSPQTRPAPNSYYGKRYLKTIPTISSSTIGKRTYSTVFENTEGSRPKKQQVMNKVETPVKNGNQDNNRQQASSTSTPKFPVVSEKNKYFTKDPRPTRYELPEELDEDNIFDNSFTNISYTSKPLMVHPETTKQYKPKRLKLFEESSNSRYMRGSSNNDIVECKKISASNSLFIDDPMDNDADESNMYHTQTLQVKDNSKGASQLFDQIIDNDSSDITIETKNKQSANLDHAKIISEVLKKYPHLVKGNKNIKLKILNTANKSKKPSSTSEQTDKEVKVKSETPDFTYETDVIDSKEAARLIAMGAENIKGPWICLICGTPGKALHFTTYYNFRKHLVEVHNEKPLSNICEFCGLKSQKRNYLVHHQLTKHDVEPPAHYNFPKCNYCKYVALNEALMVKHKLTHQIFKKNVGNNAFTSSNLIEIPSVKKTIIKYGCGRKKSLQCIYCLRNFTRETNLYAHLKTNHKNAAKSDGLIEDSEEENQEEEIEEKSKPKHNSGETSNYIKVEVPVHFEGAFDDTNVQYQIERQADGNIHVVSKKTSVSVPMAKHKILNPGYIMQKQNTTPTLSKPQKPKTTLNTSIKRNEFLQEMCESPPNNSNNEEIVVIDNSEYVLQDYQLIPKKEKSVEEYIMTTTLNTNKDDSIQTMMPTTSLEFRNIHNSNPETKMFVKKSTNVNQPIQIVVSNEEEYKALVSNQSVIFEDTDTNKSLTVLTQENSSLETATIDLDNTQTSDMMIIQDDFAINATQAVATNNPNIVVVYSHPVENQNKQYQIITTQGIETQFVPSSAIITQNYETVSTCTPVVNTHTNIDSTWQSIQTNMNKIPMASNSELHTMTVAESVTIAPEADTNSNVQVYEEVPMQTSESVQININQIVESQTVTAENNFIETNIIPSITEEINEVPMCQENTMITLEQPTVITNSTQQSIPETHIQPPANLDQPTPAHTLIPESSISPIEHPIVTTTLTPLTESCEEIQETNNLGTEFVEEMLDQPEQQITTASNETVIKSLIDKNEHNVNSNNDVTTQVDNSIQHVQDDHIIVEVPCANIANVTEDSEKLDQEMQKIVEGEITENITENVITVPTTNDKGDIPTTNINPDVNPNVVVTKVAIAQIENLTSEWSEDECDNVAEPDSKTDEPALETQNNTEVAAEVEESIENIQQEVEKHVAAELTSCLEKDENNVCNVALIENLEEKEPQQNTKISDVHSTSHEKITSLLNDWDDNDSQEEAPTEDKLNSTPQNNEENMEKASVLVDKSDSSKSNNIKSLVSDWDEDEEENKD